jgi:hypothetical protein
MVLLLHANLLLIPANPRAKAQIAALNERGDGAGGTWVGNADSSGSGEVSEQRHGQLAEAPLARQPEAAEPRSVELFELRGDVLPTAPLRIDDPQDLRVQLMRCLRTRPVIASTKRRTRRRPSDGTGRGL